MIVVPKVTYGAEALIKRRDVRHNSVLWKRSVYIVSAELPGCYK